MSDCGWQPQFLSVTDDQRQRYSLLVRNQYQEALRDFQLAPQSLRALGDLLHLCQQRGIPFALVAMPEGDSFRALYPAPAEAKFQTLLTELGQRWQARVIDARSWVPEEGFWDTHHLLPCGAAVFTQRFDREVLTPLLASPRG
jgi:hypothetical protein